jgi:hypothetical protein
MPDALARDNEILESIREMRKDVREIRSRLPE